MRSSLKPRASIEGFAPFIDAGVFSVAEVHAAERITNAVFSAVGGKPEFLDQLAVAVAVWAPVNGHVCATLDRLDEQVFAEFRREDVPDEPTASNLPWPDPTVWKKQLVAGPLVGPASENDVDLTRPLVLDGYRLYLTRQWVDEGVVVDKLGTRLQNHGTALPPDAEGWLSEVFTDPVPNLQRDAVRNALTHNTTVLLGGPGTGKTYTIAAMLHVLHREHAATAGPDAAPLRVAVAAPTAKASRQIGKSITDALPHFPKAFAEEMRRIGKEAATIHRLLGTMRQSRGRFRHHERNHLPYDVVIIDEVSMVSLALMARLLEALAPETRLVLVGDGEQLKSVENGAVLPEIAALRDGDVEFPIVTLTVNRRQQDDSKGGVNRIGQLAEKMRSVGKDVGATPSEILDFLRESSTEISWVESPDDVADPIHPHLVIEKIRDDLDAFSKAKAAATSGNEHEALHHLARIRVLCGHRKGRYGVKDWNSAIAKSLSIPLDRTSPGLPLLNTRNDLRTGLVNGDTGIVVEHDGTPFAVFRIAIQTIGEDGGEAAEEEQICRFEPTSLDSVEISFATTVHKAQGSQYETAIVVCPPHTSPLATRELIYTAATRATRRLVIIGSPKSLKHAIKTSVRRESGLASRVLRRAMKAQGA
jgi:exodeoxyribonuclease V alpha subunit